MILTGSTATVIAAIGATGTIDEMGGINGGMIPVTTTRSQKLLTSTSTMTTQQRLHSGHLDTVHDHEVPHLVDQSRQTGTGHTREETAKRSYFLAGDPVMIIGPAQGPLHQ